MNIPSKELVQIMINEDIRYMGGYVVDDLIPYETSKGWNTITVSELSNQCKSFLILNGVDCKSNEPSYIFELSEIKVKELMVLEIEGSLKSLGIKKGICDGNG